MTGKELIKQVVEATGEQGGVASVSDELVSKWLREVTGRGRDILSAEIIKEIFKHLERIEAKVITAEEMKIHISSRGIV